MRRMGVNAVIRSSWKALAFRSRLPLLRRDTIMSPDGSNFTLEITNDRPVVWLPPSPVDGRQDMNGRRRAPPRGGHQCQLSRGLTRSSSSLPCQTRRPARKKEAVTVTTQLAAEQRGKCLLCDVQFHFHSLAEMMKRIEWTLLPAMSEAVLAAIKRGCFLIALRMRPSGRAVL